MARRLPPLISLRVFESVARHLSFTKAAEELHVTQAAVSHQVKKLEEWLGISLFMRLNRSIKLTKEGEAYARPLREAFDQLAHATDDLIRNTGPQTLNITTFDSIAANWLAPRIKHLQAEIPGAAIKIITRNYHSDFSENDIDVEIRYGDGNWPRLHVTKIADEQIFPVCSPKLLGRKKKLKDPEEAKEYDLIHDEMVMEWSDWFEAAGASTAGATKGLRYNHSHIVLQAAIAGEGMALGRSLLVAHDLAKGRLIAPFDIKIDSKFAYYMVCPKEVAEQPKICAFRSWLLEEAIHTIELYG